MDNKYNNSKIINFSRHYKTNLNNNNIFIGQSIDVDILKKKKLKINNVPKIDLCFSSPLLRCVNSAKLLTKNNIAKINELKEIDYGLAEGLTLFQLSKQFPNITNAWD